jgi:hypothetical protein
LTPFLWSTTAAIEEEIAMKRGLLMLLLLTAGAMLWSDGGELGLFRRRGCGFFRRRCCQPCHRVQYVTVKQGPIQKGSQSPIQKGNGPTNGGYEEAQDPIERELGAPPAAPKAIPNIPPALVEDRP